MQPGKDDNQFSNSTEKVSLMKRMISSVAKIASGIGRSDQSQITALQEEISNLEELSNHIFQELDYCNVERDKIIFSKTWKGKYFNALGYLFSLYCIYKIFMVIFKLIL